MKALYLYVDKWYIVGVVNSDGVCRPISPSNKEDRFWLYFYEDVTNDEISYGKSFHSKFRDGEIHYYGDVFSLLTDPSAGFMKFNRKQPIVGIFSDSKILDELRDAVGGDFDIDTYLSFSKDISLPARHIFLQELKKERFVVKQNVARIEHLALEYSLRKELLGGEGFFLVLNSCNEDLHCSIYQHSGDIIVRNDEEESLPGMGTDVRRRALAEVIVNSINEREHILHTREEKDAEYLRLASLADLWLPKFTTSSFIPISLSGITFSNDSHRIYDVSVRKSKLDELTASIVKDIINAVTKFVSNSGLSREHVIGVLLLGDAFANSQYANELSTRYSVSSDQLPILLEKDISSILSAYSFIDISQFDAIQNKQANDAEVELRRVRQLQEQAKEAAEAAAIQSKVDEQKRLAKESERKFQEAKERGYDAELKHNFHDMEEYFGIARELDPDDDEVARKYEDARRLIAEQKVAQDNFKKNVQEAQLALKNSDWETALQKAVGALSYVPDSAEAARIKSASESKIKASKEFERYIDRADMFYAQKLYNQALEELNKALLLDYDDSVVKERVEKIQKEQADLGDKIENLTRTYESSVALQDFEAAIKACDALVDFDNANSRRWSETLSELKEEKKKADGENLRLSNLTDKIDDAFFNDSWADVIEFCHEYLAIRRDAKIEDKLAKAQSRLRMQQASLKHDEVVDEINNLIASGRLDVANRKIESAKDILSDTERKNLHKAVFEAESKSKRQPIGFKTTRADAFFDEPAEVSSKGKSVKQTGDDDFFDSSKSHAQTKKQTGSQSKGTFFDKDNKASSSKGMLTNDDFNF